MSGSGGYFKYQCKNWNTYNCTNWVWANGYACADCMAAGRDSDTVMISGSSHGVEELYVPHLENGLVQYTASETIFASDKMTTSTLKDASSHQLPMIAEAPSVNLKATEEYFVSHQPSKSGFSGTLVEDEVQKWCL